MPDLDTPPLPTILTLKSVGTWLLMLVAPFGVRKAFSYLGKRGKKLDEVRDAINEMHRDIKGDINNLSLRLDAHIDGRLIHLPTPSASSKNGSEQEANK